MPHDPLPADLSRLTTFRVFDAHDTEDLDFRSRWNERLPESVRAYQYRLQDRALWRRRFDAPVFSLASRRAGALLVTYSSNRFAMEVAVKAGAGDLFCFAMPLRGDFLSIQGGAVTRGTKDRGLVLRSGEGSRFLASDESARVNVFLHAGTVEAALEHLLDKRLGRPLAFDQSLDWSRGLAASLRAQLHVLIQEFERSDGVADNAVALASMTDCLVTLTLHAVRHDWSDQLEARQAGAAPAHIRRAEEFMRANAAAPIRMTEIAFAAGCSVRTLSGVFQQFRGTTPLGALHAIRLERVRAELRLAAGDETVAMIARRYGFTNASRFNAAFRRRFGAVPAEVARCAVPARC